MNVGVIGLLVIVKLRNTLELFRLLPFNDEIAFNKMDLFPKTKTCT